MTFLIIIFLLMYSYFTNKINVKSVFNVFKSATPLHPYIFFSDSLWILTFFSLSNYSFSWCLLLLFALRDVGNEKERVCVISLQDALIWFDWLIYKSPCIIVYLYFFHLFTGYADKQIIMCTCSSKSFFPCTISCGISLYMYK